MIDPAELGAKRLAANEPAVEVLAEHCDGFLGFMHKYGLNEEVLRTNWQASVTVS